MSAPYQVSILGAKEFSAEMTRLAESLYEDEAGRVYLAAAKVIAAEARRLAPMGRYPAFAAISYQKGTGQLRRGYQKAPGRLRKAIVAAQFKRAKAQRFGPGAYAQVNLKRSRGVTAPYGHIVAGGRRAAVARKGYFFWREGSGSRQFVKTRTVAGFAGRDYFQRAVVSRSQAVLDRATEEVRRQIERRYR